MKTKFELMNMDQIADQIRFADKTRKERRNFVLAKYSIYAILLGILGLIFYYWMVVHPVSSTPIFQG